MGRLKNSVSNAARDGKIYELKDILAHRPRHQVEQLVAARKDKSTPLILACINGHLDVAEYLLQKCHSDVDQVGSVVFEDEIHPGVSPLWCAAVAGHLKLVKILVGNFNASVNTETPITKDTPLHAACRNGLYKHHGCSFDMAKYLIEHGADINLGEMLGMTCLMIAAFHGNCEFSKYLLECGADVNGKGLSGRTVLHICAGLGHLELLKIFLKHGARYDTDTAGETPLKYAAKSGHESVVDYIVEHCNCTKQDIMDAFELLGATFVNNERCLTSARKYWRRAMELRYENGALPFQKRDAKSPISSYVNAKEIRSYDDLATLTDDEMNIQALVVRERVLGLSNPGVIHSIRSLGTQYAENGNFKICIQLWMYVLEMERNRGSLSFDYVYCLSNFIELFYKMLYKAWHVSNDFSTISFNQIFRVYEYALEAIKRTLDGPQIQGQNLINIHCHNMVRVAMHLLSMMCQLRPYLNENETLALKTAAYKLVHMNPKGKNGFTPLHFASSKDSFSVGGLPMFKFPSVDVVNLLLEVGACPNAVDLIDNTPLHIAAMKKHHSTYVFMSLLNHGSHLDLCNKANRTPLQLVQDNPLLVLYPLQHLNLQCLCAQTINMYKIPYEGLVHEKLCDFLNTHCSH